MKPTKSKSRARKVSAGRRDPLAKIRGDLDALVAHMQTPEQQAGVEALFAADEMELGKIAQAHARRAPPVK
jgi:hypothetical protein